MAEEWRDIGDGIRIREVTPAEAERLHRERGNAKSTSKSNRKGDRQ